MRATNDLNLSNRTKTFQQLEAQVFDLLVIGGGITGAGIARDAALRGLSVALIEAQDFASGTSSRSSKMIHGGLRYLVKGDIPIVKESASERATLHRIAPHLAKQSLYIIPVSSLVSELTMRVALWVYERLGRVAAVDHHQVWNASELARREPLIDVRGLRGAVVYPEYLTDDARLTIATIRSAFASGACVSSYTKATAIRKSETFSVLIAPTLPGEVGEYEVCAKAVVNAAGPWVDAVCRLDQPTQVPRLALSRGVHIVVAHSRLPVNHTVVMSTPDNRRIFAVPLGGYTYLGTTDDYFPDSQYWPPVTEEDIDYLFATTNQKMPDAKLTKADIVSVWSGIRPLVGGDNDKAAKELSRKDEVWESVSGMLSVGGGKLSAYRAMAERIVDRVVSDNGFSAQACQTHERPLPGGEQPVDPATLDVASTMAAERLARLYGTEASQVVAAGANLCAEVRHAVHSEGALRLEDYWARRSSRAWFDEGAGIPVLEAAAASMADMLDWDSDRQQMEIDNCKLIDTESRKAFSE